MDKKDRIVITGTWPSEWKTVGDLIARVVAEPDASGPPVQLRQTFGECEIEQYESSYNPDLREIEQYRAFCNAWELWIRSSNAQYMRFRFIAEPGACEDFEGEIDCVEDLMCEKNCFECTEGSYPLVGKPLTIKDKNGQAVVRWYTEKIPRILKYEVNGVAEKRGKVSVKAEDLIDPARLVRFVRLTGLEVNKREKEDRQ